MMALRILEKQPYEKETADADEQLGAIAWIHGSKTCVETIKTLLARILSSGDPHLPDSVKMQIKF